MKKIILRPHCILTNLLRDITLFSEVKSSDAKEQLPFALGDLADRYQVQLDESDSQWSAEYKASKAQAAEEQENEARRARELELQRQECLATLAECESHVDALLEVSGVGIEHLREEWPQMLESLAKLRRAHRTLRLELSPREDIDVSDNKAEAAE